MGVSYGKIGYEAYARATGGKTYDGRDMPAWDGLPENIQRAWSAAAVGVLTDLARRRGAVSEECWGHSLSPLPSDGQWHGPFPTKEEAIAEGVAWHRGGGFYVAQGTRGCRYIFLEPLITTPELVEDGSEEGA